MLVWGKWTILEPNMVDPHNFGLARRIFLKFCTMNGHLGPRMLHPESKFWISFKDCFTFYHNEWGQERHGNHINCFSERNLIAFRAIWSFWNKGGMVSSSLWICSQVFLLILLNEKDQEVYENFFSCFLRKTLIWGNLIFSGHSLMFDWVWSKLSQATITIGSLESQDMI